MDMARSCGFNSYMGGIYMEGMAGQGQGTLAILRKSFRSVAGTVLACHIGPSSFGFLH
tara:strand:+ start:85752 stop:85925 length:174 start_codon:yes stop_codon:yes gene_type:complete